jgi:hypothetical protein
VGSPQETSELQRGRAGVQTLANTKNALGVILLTSKDRDTKLDVFRLPISDMSCVSQAIKEELRLFYNCDKKSRRERGLLLWMLCLMSVV